MADVLAGKITGMPIATATYGKTRWALDAGDEIKITEEESNAI